MSSVLADKGVGVISKNRYKETGQRTPEGCHKKITIYNFLKSGRISQKKGTSEGKGQKNHVSCMNLYKLKVLKTFVTNVTSLSSSVYNKTQIKIKKLNIFFQTCF